MKILTIAINYLPTVGGISNHIYYLNKFLYNRKIDVSILQIVENSSKNEYFYEIIDDSPFPLHRLHIKQKLTLKTIFIYRQTILKLIGKKFPNIDLIHVHEFKNTEFLVYKSGYKWIYTNHSSHFIEMMNYKSIKKKLLKYFMKIILLDAAHIISVSTIMEKLVLKLLKNPSKSTYIPNGVDIDKFSNSKIKIKFDLPQNKTIVLVPARWNHIKGIHVVIAAMKKLKYIKNNFFFVFAGAGEGNNQYQKLIYQELKSLNNYKVYSSVDYDSIPSLYAVSDIILLPSLYETGGIIPLEAMASRKTILASRVGNIVNIVKNEENGFLFESENETDLITRLLYIANNHDECVKISQRAFLFIYNNYSWDEVAKKTITVYNQLIKLGIHE